jgi:hypothetical protein
VKLINSIAMLMHSIYGNMDRVIPVVAAYFFTSILLITSIVVLNRIVGAEQTKTFMTYVFIASLAAGLDPGTAKSALVKSNHLDSSGISISLLAASFIKACIVSPALVLIWFLSTGELEDIFFLVLIPMLTGIGFLATDIRVFLDARGRSASAIWLKQGSLSLAIICTAVALALNYSLVIGILISCAVRLFWMIGFILSLGGVQWSWGPFFTYLMPSYWRHFLLASAIGSFAASIDRIVAFHYLDAVSTSAYVLSYEILSKFWLLPYLLGPLVFVKVAKSRSNIAFVKQCYLLIAIAGIPFLFFAAALPYIPIESIQLAGLSPWGLTLFSSAILIAAFNQIIVSKFQASGSEAMVTSSATLGLLVACLGFPILLWLMGINGLFLAWTLKSLSEFAALKLLTFKRKSHELFTK